MWLCGAVGAEVEVGPNEVQFEALSDVSGDRWRWAGFLASTVI